MKSTLISLLVVLVPILLLGLPVIVLATMLGVGGWQGFLLGALTGACHFAVVVSVITFFKLEDEYDTKN